MTLADLPENKPAKIANITDPDLINRGFVKDEPIRVISKIPFLLEVGSCRWGIDLEIAFKIPINYPV